MASIWQKMIALSFVNVVQRYRVTTCLQRDKGETRSRVSRHTAGTRKRETNTHGHVTAEKATTTTTQQQQQQQ